jgi:soluble lytic murein transglycosylase-like protein
MLNRSEHDVRPSAVERLTRRRRRRQQRQVLRLTALGLAMAAVGQFLRPIQAPEVGGADIAQTLELAPIWRPVESVLARPVGEGPWRPAAVTVAGIDESTRNLLRWNTVFTFARRYRVTMELAGLIHDTALEEKIEPELAFRLVRLESRFDQNAVSGAGAIGLTQLMLGTARYFQPGVTAEDLTDPATNLRIGFRYLRGLIREYRGDLKLALLVYNRGPTAVLNAIAMGEDPANGYDRILMRGYKGTGVID